MLHISIQISVAQATNRPATFQSSDGTLVVLSPDPVCFSVDTWPMMAPSTAIACISN